MMITPGQQSAGHRQPRQAVQRQGADSVGRRSRWPWVMFGVASLWAARRRPGASRALLTLLGASLLAGGARRSQRPQRQADLCLHHSVSVAADPAAAYALWRDPAQLLRFMRHIRDIEPLGPGRARWVLKPAAHGPLVSWEAILVDDVPGEIVTWQSSANEPMHTSLSVLFRGLQTRRLTEVTLRLHYTVLPRDGGVARALRPSLEHEIAADLRAFKQLLETGEIPTIRGQSSGRAEEDNPLPEEMLL